MSPLKLRLKPKELERVRYLLGIEEPRVIRRANILNCLHLGYVSSDIAAILNVDPKKPVALFSDATPRLPPRGPAEVMIKDYEYVRAGSANVFCALEPKVGRYINKVTDCRDGLEFSMRKNFLDASTSLIG